MTSNKPKNADAVIAYSVGIPVAVGGSHYLSPRRIPPPELGSDEQTLPPR